MNHAEDRGRSRQAPELLFMPRFTESQAKSRIEAGGYSNVTELKKDDKGVWRGKAMKDGKSLTVSVDFQGNVIAR
jgi:hypothetical protein